MKRSGTDDSNEPVLFQTQVQNATTILSSEDARLASGSRSPHEGQSDPCKAFSRSEGLFHRKCLKLLLPALASCPFSGITSLENGGPEALDGFG
jgi:hypothetical protein